MRRDDAVFRREQRIVRPDRLHRNHIQPGGVHPPAVQRVGQVLLHHQRPAPVVDENDPRLHPFNALPVDEALGLRGQRAVQADHVRLCQQLLQRHIVGNGLALRAGAAAAGQYLHAHGRRHAAQRPANAAEPYNAHGFARQPEDGRFPEAEIRASGPFSLMHQPVVQAHAAADLQQQRHGVLGHLLGAVGGHVAHRNAPLPGRFQIHHVVAGGQHPDKLQVRGRGDGRPRQGRFVGVHRFGIPNAGAYERLIVHVGAVVHRHIPQRFQALPAQVTRVFRMAVQYHDFHVAPLFCGCFFVLQKYPTIPPPPRQPFFAKSGGSARNGTQPGKIKPLTHQVFLWYNAHRSRGSSQRPSWCAAAACVNPGSHCFGGPATV